LRVQPTLNYVKTIAVDPTGNLRDPSAMVQDSQTKLWHFWVDYMPGSHQPGWHAVLHHYSAPEITGPWTNHGLALNHSTDPAAWDYAGQVRLSLTFLVEVLVGAFVAVLAAIFGVVLANDAD
jgi:hypothetical protein